MKKWDIYKSKLFNSNFSDSEINTLMSENMKNYIFEIKDLEFLNYVLNSNNDELKNFYFNDNTIELVLKLILEANNFDILSNAYFFDNFYNNTKFCISLAQYDLKDNKLMEKLPNNNYIFSILNGYLFLKNYEWTFLCLQKIYGLNKTDLDYRYLINILNNPLIIKIIMECSEYDFSLILKWIYRLEIDKLTKIYTSKEFIKSVRENGLLNGIYDAIYYVLTRIDKNFFNVEEIVLDRDNLKNIGKVCNEEIFDIFGRVHPECCFPGIQYDHDNERFDYSSSISGFVKLFKFYANVELKYQILDFFLINAEYWGTFDILKRRMNESLIRDYFKTRKNLIDDILKNQKDNEKFLILFNLPQDILSEELILERENIFLDISNLNYCRMYHYYKYKFSDKLLKNSGICSIFLDNHWYDKNGESEVKKITDNDILAHKVFIKTKKYKLMYKLLMGNLTDSAYDFWVYLDMIKKSSFQDIYDSEFINDMRDIVFYSKPERIREVFYKYKNVNLNKMKEDILKKMKTKSTNDIIKSLTNISRRVVTKEVFILDKKKVVLPVIYFSGEKFNFLCRRMRDGEHLFNGNYIEKFESYSVICDENRSVYYGDDGIKFGYSNIKPEDIVHMNSLDSICNNFHENKYHRPGLKTPEWLLMGDLNHRTKLNGTYNELRIKGKNIPDFVISYDEPNDETIRYAYKHNVPLVKILRKSYLSSIENCKDIYSNWQ